MKNLVVAIHQPEYLPWLGYLHKIKNCDLFVLLDDVQFNRASMQHRARIVGQDGTRWITIPYVHGFPQVIRDVKVADKAWAHKHALAIRNAYGHAPAFAEVWNTMALTLNDCGHQDGVGLICAHSTDALLYMFGINTGWVLSSSLGISSTKSDRVLDICKELGATTYLCGRTSAAKYLDHDAFRKAGVHVTVQSFDQPPYRQLPADAQCVSAVDALMYLGVDGTKELLQ